MKPNKIILAVSVVAVMSASSFAWSKDSVLHEAQWGQVISYSNVPVSKDSAKEYGPWNEAPQPAAGGPVAGLPGAGQAVQYTPAVAVVAAPAPVAAPVPAPAPAPVPRKFD